MPKAGMTETKATKAQAMKASAKTPGKAELRYQSGFGNEFASEAVEGVLPRGQNLRRKWRMGYTRNNSAARHSPRRAPSIAGHGFTACVRRWRTSPSQPISPKRLRSAPFDEVPTPPNQLRWKPIPIPSEPTDFVNGLITMAGNGNAHTHAGVAMHIYVANRSMTDRFFYNADGEMLIVPQKGRLLLRTEMGFSKPVPARLR